MATSDMPRAAGPAPRLEALRKEVFDCSRCGFCRVWDWKGVDWVCPTYPYTEAYDTQYARGRLNMAQAILKGEAEVDETFLEHLAQCTLCGSCGAHCPVGLPLLEIWSALRADLVDAGYVTANQAAVRDNTVLHHSIFGPSRRPAAAAAPRKVDVLYFPGCQTTRKARSVGKSTTDLLDKLGVDYAVLEEDACCGYPLFDIGQIDAMKQAAEYTLARIQAYQPDIVLTTCAGCYRAFSVVYPELLGLQPGVTFQHTHDFFPPRVAGKLRAVDRTVTYHDPCVMGRHMGLYDEPRATIRAVPGVALVEMYSHREHALCCGAGGGTLSAFTDLAGDVAVERLRQAAAAGATQVVTSCPTCVVNLKRSVGKAGVDLAVTDIVDLLNEAL
jgi:Fe-S oxidoreductase